MMLSWSLSSVGIHRYQLQT